MLVMLVKAFNVPGEICKLFLRIVRLVDAFNSSGEICKPFMRIGEASSTKKLVDYLFGRYLSC